MRNGFKTLFMAGALAALAGVNGVAQEALAIRAKVPFDFTVGNTSVAAGEYMVTRDAARNSMRITSVDTGAALQIVRLPAEKNTTGLRYALVFHRYGDRHFLREIWTGDTANGTRVPMSRAEKELMAAQAPAKTTIAAASSAQ